MSRVLGILLLFLAHHDGLAQSNEIRGVTAESPDNSPLGSVVVGPLEVPLSLPLDWALLSDVSGVKTILDAEGVQNPAVFAFKNARGAYIYATYGEFSNFAISAREIISTPPPQSMIEAWGLVREEVRTEIIEVSSGLEGALMSAEGAGSGRDFVSKKTTPTVAVWVDIPYVFRDHDRLRSGMTSLFFRSPKAISREALHVFFDLVDGIRPRPQYSSASAQEFFLWLEEGKAGLQNPAEVAGIEQAPGSSLTADLLMGWTRDALEDHVGDESVRRLELLESLAVQFPANPYLESEISRLEPLRRESELVRRFLANDVDGRRREALEGFHRSALKRQRKLTGQTGAEQYLAYIDRVWPKNPIVSPPPAEHAQVTEWIHPLLGIEMILLTPESGVSFWISRRPVLEYLRSSAEQGEEVPGTSGSFLTWSDACKTAESFGLLLPRPEHYRALARSGLATLSRTLMYWAQRPEASREDLAVKLSASAVGSSGDPIRIVRRKLGYRLSNGDFHAVFSHRHGT